MNITSEMLASVKERMSFMYLDYRRYMEMPSLEHTSVGLVARFGGERTSQTYRITKLTEQLAIERANRSEEVLEKLAWLECAWAVFTRLMTGRNGSSATIRKNRKVAHIMHLHVFMGWTFTKIASEPLPKSKEPVSRQRIQQLYNEAVWLVAEEAMNRGLLRTVPPS